MTVVIRCDGVEDFGKGWLSELMDWRPRTTGNGRWWFRNSRDGEQPTGPGSEGQDSEPREGVSSIWLRYSEGQSLWTPRNHRIASPRTVSSKI